MSRNYSSSLARVEMSIRIVSIWRVNVEMNFEIEKNWVRRGNEGQYEKYEYEYMNMNMKVNMGRRM